jgi:hypothetical protein
MGFVAPVLSILFSLFPKGVKSLANKYENEIKKSEENLTNETNKKKGENLDVPAIEKNLKIIGQNRIQAEDKLSYLNPLRLIPKIFLPFIFSLLGVIPLFLKVPLWVTLASFSLSFILFLLGLRTLWKSFSVLVEVAEIVNTSKEDNESKQIELLSTLVEKSGDKSLFLDPEKINIKFNDENLITSSKLIFTINKKYDLSVVIVNSDERMAKNVEVGFTFPLDFLVEKTPNVSSIYTGDNKQIIRFNEDVIQGNEKNIQGNMQITFLKLGDFPVQVFIKGENIKPKKTSFSIEIIN